MTAYKIAVSNFALEGKKLMPGDPRWGAFNGSFVNHELRPAEIMDVIYAGKPITTHHQNKWRTTANYLCGQHIGLDFDTEDQFSTLGHLEKDKFVSKYAALIHTTISHTIEKPRARVVFLVDAPIYQPKNYATAAAALLWLFGKADRQCKDPVRFFYGAPECEFEFINQVLPLDVLKKLIDQYRETGNREKRKADRPDYLPPATQQEAAEALKFINPWQIDYDEWLGVLMGLHSEFGDGGLSLAESWAEGKEGEVSQKWRSFDQAGNEAGRIGIGTMFAIAQRFGWGRPI